MRENEAPEIVHKRTLFFVRYNGLEWEQVSEQLFRNLMDTALLAGNFNGDFAEVDLEYQ